MRCIPQVVIAGGFDSTKNRAAFQRESNLPRIIRPENLRLQIERIAFPRDMR